MRSSKIKHVCTRTSIYLYCENMITMVGDDGGEEGEEEDDGFNIMNKVKSKDY